MSSPSPPHSLHCPATTAVSTIVRGVQLPPPPLWSKASPLSGNGLREDIRRRGRNREIEASIVISPSPPLSATAEIISSLPVHRYCCLLVIVLAELPDRPLPFGTRRGQVKLLSFFH
ncbi:unnamed protein product [Linum tenue]|uniref:Uncharacterized protein n=1 Tax=Linum tenue TaxID=586396 RepID=A0AAV0GUA2_9ROSI|nr:unnamed protein product [Linum tenue]